jgi:hypothetical protein
MAFFVRKRSGGYYTYINNLPNMKRFISHLLITAMALVSLAPMSTAETEDFNCGEWYDVPDTYMEVIETVCEYGIMQGMSEDYFGYNHMLTRAEMAVIGNRLVYGTSNYDNIYEYSGFSTAMFNYLLVPYNDAPEDLVQNTWILKAMFFSSDLAQEYSVWPNGIMTGDGDSGYTSFRPLENVNIAEAYKVLYEAAEMADVLEQDYEFTYAGSPWYGNLLNYLNDNSGITSLDLDAQTLYLGGDIGKSYGPFYNSVYREHVAQFIYQMIDGGVIDGTALAGHVSSADSDAPDLEVYALDHSPSSANDTDAVEFTGIVSNSGMDGAAASVLYYYIGGSTVPYEIAIPSLNGNGDEYEFTLELDAGDLSAQSYQNYIVVDAEDDVEEENENNNEEYYSFTVADNDDMPDLTLSNLEIWPEVADRFDTITVSGEIWNIGSADADDSVLRINVGSGYGLVYNVPSISSGLYHSFEIEIDPDKIGYDTDDYEVYVNADDYEDLEESNEDNNAEYLDLVLYYEED